MFFEFICIPDWYETQEKCESVVFEDPFMIVYCFNKYKTHEMCDEAVANCLKAFKFIPDWFVTSKLLKELDKALHANGDILF